MYGQRLPQATAATFLALAGVAVPFPVPTQAEVRYVGDDTAVQPASADGLPGHHEVPDDPPAPKPTPPTDRPQVRSGPWIRGPFESIQVNVDEQGNNILGDAANEPSIAIDPTDPNKMVIGWRQFDSVLSNFRQAGWAYSHDGGQTWTFPGVIEPGVFRSDPVLDADADGDFYYYSLRYQAGDYNCDLFKSVDGGVSWQEGIYAFGGDKAWMAVDRTGGIGHGNLYFAWDYAGCCGVNWFTRSTDRGQTFDSPVQIPGRPIWGVTAVGPDGEVYVVGRFYSTDSRFVAAKSSTIRDPSAPLAFDFAREVQLGGRQIFDLGYGPNPGGLLGQVWVAVDHSDGPTRGNVYMLCSVDPLSTDPLDVMFARSIDGGDTWSEPVRINDDLTDNGAWQWFGTMSVAPNGRIDVIWNDTRNDPGGYNSELYYAYSIDAGQTWSANQPLSIPWDPQVGWPNQNKIGDYYDMVSDDEGASLAYAATFNGEQDVYYLRLFPDCNENGEPDLNDIAGSTSQDCNENVVPDECDIALGTSQDGNQNGVPDECDDCNGNQVLDMLEPPVVLFQNAGSSLEALDTTAPVAQDLHLVGWALVRQFTVQYRSTGSTPGVMMVRFFEGTSGGGVVPVYPDGLIGEYDCGQLQWTDGNPAYRVVDLDPGVWIPSHLWMEVEIEQDAGVILRSGPAGVGYTQGLVYDRQAAEMLPGPKYMGLRILGIQCTFDCNANDLPDTCDIACEPAGGPCNVAGCGQSADCNENAIPDECDIAEGTSQDANGNGVPDECQCICGDVDRSGGLVDLWDVATFVSCYGLTAPAMDCDQAAFFCSDLDGDGIVDLSDFSTLALWFGLESTQTVPDCTPE